MKTQDKLPPNLRPLEPGYDLTAVADLIELCFAENLDADGRRYIRQRCAAVSALLGRRVARLRWPLSHSR